MKKKKIIILGAILLLCGIVLIAFLKKNKFEIVTTDRIIIKDISKENEIDLSEQDTIEEINIQDETVEKNSIEIPEKFKKILNNEEKITINGKSSYFKELKNEIKDINENYIMYCFLNIDSKDEMVIKFNDTEDTILILHSEDNNIYGYVFKDKDFLALKEDGTFLGVSNDILKFNFNKEEAKIVELCSFNNTTGKYYINEKECSLKEYEKLYEEYINNKKAEWYYYKTNELAQEDMDSLNLSEETGIQVNTFKSLQKCFYPDESVITYYYLSMASTGYGDSRDFYENESNYSQYCIQDYNEDNYKINLKKYSNIIHMKIAMWHESAYLAFDNLEGKSEIGSEEEVIKRGKEKNYKKVGKDWHDLSLEEKVKINEEYGYGYEYEENNTQIKWFSDQKDNFFEIMGMLVMNGNNLSDEEWINNSRAKKIKITINGEKSYVYYLRDTKEAQLINLNYKQTNILKPISVDIEVLEKYSGDKTSDVYISDIQFGFESSAHAGR